MKQKNKQQMEFSKENKKNFKDINLIYLDKEYKK